MPYSTYITQDGVNNLISKLSGKEVVRQFADHQPFVLSGLDEKEELRSRMAFVDAYKKEFEELHAEIKKLYRNEGDKNEFDYLKEDNFRKAASTPVPSKLNPLKMNNVFLLDMMKDYMTYQHMMGKVSTQHYNSFLSKDSEKEKEFRKQRLTKKEKEFLIEESVFSDAKKQGLRECRKWMYRNASKSGIFNDTGSKRNYIDSFAKKKVQIQANTIYQIEKGLYKYDEATDITIRNAMSPGYVPSFDKFKKMMVRSKKNPYNFYNKAVGNFYYWSRMERALRKTESKSLMVERHYAEASLEDKLNAPVGSIDKSKSAIHETGHHYRIVNPVGDARDYNRINKVLKEFGEERDKYLKILTKLQKNRNDESLFLDLIYQGIRIQRFVKVKENKVALERAEKILGKENAISSFVDFTLEIQRKNKLMDNTEIEKIKREKAGDGMDLAVSIKGFGDKGYAAASGVAGFFTTSEKLAKVTNGFSFGTAMSSAYLAVKSTFMSLISWRRKKKAEKVQEENRDLKNYSKTKGDPDIEGRKLNDMAKISKKRNSFKAKNYAAQGSFAAAAVGFTVMGIVGLGCLPLTIAGGIIGGIGFGVKYAMDYYQNKKLAGKALDTIVKTEEYEKQKAAIKNSNDINPIGNSPQDQKRFIDKKVEERKNLLEEKKERFTDNQSSFKVLDNYTKSPDKMKNRIRESWAVEKGCSSVYSFSTSNDKEMVMNAYRHMFLKDPEGPIDKANLLTPEQVKQYMSIDPLDRTITGQTREQAKRRALYRDLLKSEGIQTEAPKDVMEARERFTAKKKPANAADKQKGKSL